MATLVDTSYLFALTNQNDQNHAACLEVATTLQGVLILPITVLPEIAYLLDSRLGHHVMRQVMEQLVQPAWTLEMVNQVDLERANAILAQYADNRLDFVDATIVAIAERLNVKQILTLDRRHFGAIRPLHCHALTILP